MNTLANSQQSAVTDALGKMIAARLSEGAETLPHDISERLKVARAQAIAKRRKVSLQVASEITVSGGELGEPVSRWARLRLQRTVRDQLGVLP